MRNDLRAKGGEKGWRTNVENERERGIGEKSEREDIGMGKRARGMHGKGRERRTARKGRWRTRAILLWIPRYNNRSMRLRFAVPKWAGLEMNSRVRSRLPDGLTAHTPLPPRLYAILRACAPLRSNRCEMVWVLCVSTARLARERCVHPSIESATRMTVLTKSRLVFIVSADGLNDGNWINNFTSPVS